MNDPTPSADQTPATDRSPSTALQRELFVVGIGASAGGLEALEQLFQNLPADLGAAYVVVQHLSPDFKSHMEQLLGRQTSMRVRLAQNEMQVQPNAVYLIPAKKEMIISDGRLLLTDKDPERGLSHPIDNFFRSLANDFGRRAVAVVLSGTGSDGSRGVRDVHEAGGLVLCQEPTTAQFDGMPVNAQHTGSVDVSLAPGEMGRLLERFIRQSESIESLVGESEPDDDPAAMQTIFEALRQRYSVDFSLYKPSTVGRRVRRRLVLGRFATIDDYARACVSSDEELERLYHDLLIGVTQFFRDSEAFEHLEHEVVPPIVSRVCRDDHVRVWDAGVATGEEAYSVAMLFDEQLGRQRESCEFKLFATDLHRGSLDTAGRGIYPATHLEHVSDERRERYFEAVPGGYRVRSELRKSIVFAPHDLLRDAPFTQVDLIVCRNLLIYLQPPAQKKVLSLFHFSLKAGGILMLGPSETPGDLTDEFEVINKRWKIYRKRRDVRLPVNLNLLVGAPAMRSAPATTPPLLASSTSQQSLLATYDQLLGQYMPPSFLIDESGDILHTFGGAERYLVLRGGRSSNRLVDNIDAKLRTALLAALQHVARDSHLVRYKGLTCGDDVQPQVVELSVALLPRTPNGTVRLLVELRPSEGAASRLAPHHDLDSSRVGQDQVDALESELVFTRENLQSTVEELETTNEELQATNEELVASNEELQSTNEELHSVNEELFTVNGEHQRKIEELTQLTQDMENLFSSTEAGVIFLDDLLHIRKFTPKMAELLHLLPHDLGRSVEPFLSHIKPSGLLDDVRAVLAQGQPVDREVTLGGGRHYLLRIRKYTSLATASSVLITLFDVQLLKDATIELQQQKEVLASILTSTAEGIIAVDDGGICTLVNRAGARMLGYDDDSQLVGRDLCEFLHRTPSGGIDRDADCAICGSIRTGKKLHSQDATFYDRDGKAFPVEFWCHPLNERSQRSGAVISFFNTSDRQLTAEQLRLKSKIVELAHDAIFVWRMDGGIGFWNRGAEQLYGYAADEAHGHIVHDLLQTQRNCTWDEFERELREHGVWVGELVHTAKDGSQITVSSRQQLLATRDGSIWVMEVNRDISESLRVREALTQAQHVAEAANHAKSQFLAHMSHELRTPLTAILGFTDILSSQLNDPEMQQRTETIRRNGVYLLELLNDILDLSKIEAGKMTFTSAPVELPRLIQEIVELMKVRADAKGLRMGLRFDTSIPRLVRTDQRRLRQILVNLIGNAIKFTDRGNVTVVVAVRNHLASSRLELEVTDTGIGIPRAQLLGLFRPFSQASPQTTEKYGGTGLGLSISKRLVECLGGDIDVISEPAKGSTFTIYLPLTLVDAGEWMEPSEIKLNEDNAPNGDAGSRLPRLDGTKVLVVDDRRDVRHVTRYFLQQSGATVVEADDGERGVQLALQAEASPEPVDAIVMDMQMPNVDGYQATKQLRNSGFVRPIIALTAAAMKGDSDRCLAVGCSDYLSKPIDGARLIETLHRLIFRAND